MSGTVVSVEACDAARLESRHRRSYRLGGENLVELFEIAAFCHAPALRSEACVLGGLFLEEQDLAVPLGIGRSACPKPLLGIEGFPCPVVGTHVVFAEPDLVENLDERVLVVRIGGVVDFAFAAGCIGCSLFRLQIDWTKSLFI